MMPIQGIKPPIFKHGGGTRTYVRLRVVSGGGGGGGAMAPGSTVDRSALDH